MKTHWAIAFGVVSGLLAAGIVMLTASAPRGEAIRLSPPPTIPPLIVHVAGAVTNPGVFTLPAESRTQDAIQAAGGLLPEANATSLNLAAPLQDGERLWVPYQNPKPPSAQSDSQSSPPQTSPENSQPSQSSSSLININTATQAELESLPYIGPATAQKIIAYREANGPFATIEDIQLVAGIGPATFEKIKDQITVGEQP